MTAAPEVLVVDPGSQWADRLRVLASSTPRVVVFQADPSSLDELLGQARFAIVRGTDGATEVHGDQGVVAELDAGARLFVEAWRQPRRAKSHRPGEGLAWDSAGYEPPDPPNT